MSLCNATTPPGIESFSMPLPSQVAPALEGTVAHAVDVIDRNARAQVRLVDDILDASRIISGKLRIEPRPTEVVAIIRSAIEVVRPAAHAKQITLSFEPTEPEIVLSADAERLQQVVWNLLSNAVKFRQRGGAVGVMAVRAADELTISVHDNGRGIDPVFLGRAFDRFHQEDASASRRVGGLGLGLAIVRHIVELHGGSVAAESAGPGQGSTFSFTIPLHGSGQGAPALPPSHAVAARSPADERLPGDLAGVHIVLVEDEEDTRGLLAMVLTRAGATVAEASTAEEAFALVRERPPTILLSDIGLPGEDGYALIRRVRALAPSAGGATPAIALSAYTRDADKAAAGAAGFDRHVAKPLSPDDVLGAIQDVLDGVPEGGGA